MPPADLVSFTHLAGAACHYARAPVADYGTRGRGPRRQHLISAVRDKLVACLAELWTEHPWGQAEVVVSAGAWVPQSDRRGPRDRHVQGRAYDLDSIWWPGELNLVTLQAPHQWPHYLAVECILRRHFGTVLGYDYNRAHRDHWHMDDGSPVRWDPHSRSRVLSVQACLRRVWDQPVMVDGVWGPQTKTAWYEVLRHLQIGALLEDAWDDAVQVERWRSWLLETARAGFVGL